MSLSTSTGGCCNFFKTIQVGYSFYTYCMRNCWHLYDTRIPSLEAAELFSFTVCVCVDLCSKCSELLRAWIESPLILWHQTLLPRFLFFLWERLLRPLIRFYCLHCVKVTKSKWLKFKTCCNNALCSPVLNSLCASAAKKVTWDTRHMTRLEVFSAVHNLGKF